MTRGAASDGSKPDWTRVESQSRDRGETTSLTPQLQTRQQIRANRHTIMVHSAIRAKNPNGRLQMLSRVRTLRKSD